MKYPIQWLALLTLFSLNASAANRLILCDAPQGARIDYFSFNSANLENHTFLLGRDQASSVRPRISVNDENKAVSFAMAEAAAAKASLTSSQMNVLAYDDKQISFTGLVNGAPILATYYPKTHILIYSQQATWPGPDFQGARAVIFYSRCALSH